MNLHCRDGNIACINFVYMCMKRGGERRGGRKAKEGEDKEEVYKGR